MIVQNIDANPVHLPIHGQGVLVFEISNTCHFEFTFYNINKSRGIQFVFTKEYIRAKIIPGNYECIDPKNTSGLVDLPGVYYWASLDSQNGLLYAGVGEPRLETVKYRYQLDPKFPKLKQFLESLVMIHSRRNPYKQFKVLRYLPDPITTTIPLLVKNTDELNMNTVASGTYLPKANLSVVSQKLYDCISGKQFVLDDLSFPDFSKAIEYSIATPGLWCYETLKKKSNEFSKEHPNPLETYLRITLGQNNGESPGIPYVMEIWPVGHYSPIHSHAGADAIIRVLYGSIHVELYPYLCARKDTIEPFGQADFKKDEITWISPTLNQTHRLTNLSTNKDTCITIQCYMYEKDDTKHYDYFDYIDSDGAKKQYEPDSDMDFLKFKEIMKHEWSQRPQRGVFKQLCCRC